MVTQTSEHYILIDGQDQYHAATTRGEAIEKARKLAEQTGRLIVVALVVAEISRVEDSNVIQT